MCTSSSIKKYSTSYYIASLLFSKKEQEATFVLYSFLREMDECVDTIPQNVPLLKASRAYLIHNIDTTETHIPDSVRAFKDLAKEYEFQTTWTEAFFDAMEKDIELSFYYTQQELNTYMYGSAVAVGYMMHHILRGDPRYYPQAKYLAEAFQMTNFTRDIREDYIERGRIYIPDTYIRHTLTKKALTTNPSDEILYEWKTGMDTISAYVNTLYTNSLSGIHHFPIRTATALYTAYLFYHTITKRIEQNPTLPLAKRVRVANWMKAIIIIQSFFVIIWHKTKKALSL